MTAFAKCLLAMCEQVKDILKTESRLLRLRSPVYILGNYGCVTLMICSYIMFRPGCSYVLGPPSYLGFRVIKK